MERPLRDGTIRSKRTCEQINRILKYRFPTKALCNSSGYLCLDALEKIGGTPPFSDAHVYNVIESIKDSLGDDPEIVRAVANVRREHSHCEWNRATIGLLLRIAEEDRDFSEAHLNYILVENSDSFPKTAAFRQAQLAQQAAEAQARRDAEEVLELRKTLITAHGKQRKNYGNVEFAWKEAVKRELSRVQNMDLQQLRDEVSRRSMRRDLDGMSKEERRETVREMTKSIEPPPPTQDALPMQIEHPTTYEPVALDTDSLRKMSARNYPLFKFVVRKYGHSLVNARLNGQD